MEWTAVTSRDSSRVSGGMRVGMRSASMVLPAPGGPVHRTWWPPAAATSMASRAVCCPTMSARSWPRRPWAVLPSPVPRAASPVPPVSVVAGRASGSWVSSGTGSSLSTAMSWRRLRTPSTETPGTSAASAAALSGTTTWRQPASAAARTAGRMPRTGRTRPSSPSSPIMTMSVRARGSRRPAAARTALATARSKPLPLLGTEAGLRPMVSFFCGHSAPEFTTAARTRSRLSLRLLSGRPTRVKAATPGSRSACTSMTTPSTPTRATEQARANPIRLLPWRAR